jgi:hypothetical protein
LQLEQFLAVSDAEVITGAAEVAPAFLGALPDQIAFAVPGELVAVDEVVRGPAGDDDPVRKVVTTAQTQTARRSSSRLTGGDICRNAAAGDGAEKYDPLWIDVGNDSSRSTPWLRSQANQPVRLSPSNCSCTPASERKE